jgi:hypothetical protein
MLANRRRDKLKVLIKYEINSITTISGSRAFGTPEGTNKERKRSLCNCNPKNRIPRLKEKANKKVTMMWLVGVKPKGVSPRRLFEAINKKIPNNEGK